MRVNSTTYFFIFGLLANAQGITIPPILDTYIRAEESEKVSAFDDMTLVQLIVERGEDGIESLPEGLRNNPEAMFEKDHDEFYLKYLSENRPGRLPQTLPMSVGSAFDARVKSSLHEAIFGKPDCRFVLDFGQGRISIVFDWKVKSFCSRHSASPGKGYMLCRERTVQRMVSEGALPVVPIGKRRLIPVESLRKWLSEHTKST